MESRNVISSVPCHTDMKHRANSSELRDIKQMLLSGNKDEITLAVGRVLSKINDSEYAIEMITSDMSEFLCDAMLPFDPYVSRTIYTCLGVMTRYKPFFTHNHSSFAMETVIRALHFITKSGGHDLDVRQPLNVILLIVQGYARFDVTPERKPFENLMNLLMSLLKKKPVSQEIKYQGGLIINFLFDIELRNVNNSYNLIQMCEEWFDLISAKGESFHTKTEEIINLGCSLSEKTLRYLIKDNVYSDQLLTNNAKCELKSQTVITRRIINFLIETVAPEIRNLIPSNENQEMDAFSNFFTCLIHIFTELFPQRSEIARKLSELGYIQLIKKILSQEYLPRCEKLGKICVTVLTEILLSLSDDIFRFPDMWPSGRDHFRKELTAGMTLLPLDSSTWLRKLTDNEVNRSSRLALIIYFYISSLTADSSCSGEIIYPCAMKFLDVSIGINSAPLIIKAVWFIFVMSQISKNYASPGSNSWATRKMLEVLENQNAFSLIYTHHPALLYWTFSSSRMSCRIQCEVVNLWLENRSSDCTVLDDLMKKSGDVRLAIFQLLQDGSHDQVAHLAFSSLKSFMLHSNDDTLSSNIWLLLPQILAKYTTGFSSAVKVDYIVELASLKVPDRPDASKIFRIATLLPEALQKSHLISSSSSLSLSLQLLQISLKSEDNRVLFAFLRCDHFTRRIVNGMTTDFIDVASISLKIVTILWKAKIQGDRLPFHYEKIPIDPYDLLKILDRDNAELIKLGLLLIEQMLISQFKSFLLIVKGITTEFRSMLLFRTENVLFKHLPMISNPAWKCVRHILTQEKSLIGDCFLHELIKYGLRYLKETPEMADFLIVWMEGTANGEPFYDGARRIRKNFFLETIEEIARFLAENFIENSDSLCGKILKSCKHFSVDTNREPFKSLAGRNGFSHQESRFP